jgi:hypothetical protein
VRGIVRVGVRREQTSPVTDVEIPFAGVPIAGYETGVAWYARLFGRPPDIQVTEDEVMWRFTDTAWICVVVDADRAGHAIVTLSVADLERTVEDIEGRGLAGGPIEAVGDAGRKVTYTDNDGNLVMFIEVAGP